MSGGTPKAFALLRKSDTYKFKSCIANHGTKNRSKNFRRITEVNEKTQNKYSAGNKRNNKWPTPSTQNSQNESRKSTASFINKKKAKI